MCIWLCPVWNQTKIHPTKKKRITLNLIQIHHIFHHISEQLFKVFLGHFHYYTLLSQCFCLVFCLIIICSMKPIQNSEQTKRFTLIRWFWFRSNTLFPPPSLTIFLNKEWTYYEHVFTSTCPSANIRSIQCNVKPKYQTNQLNHFDSNADSIPDSYFPSPHIWPMNESFTRVLSPVRHSLQLMLTWFCAVWNRNSKRTKWPNHFDSDSDSETFFSPSPYFWTTDEGFMRMFSAPTRPSASVCAITCGVKPNQNSRRSKRITSQIQPADD